MCFAEASAGSVVATETSRGTTREEARAGSVVATETSRGTTREEASAGLMLNGSDIDITVNKNACGISQSIIFGRSCH